MTFDLPRKDTSGGPLVTVRPATKAPPAPVLPKHVQRDVPEAKDAPRIIRPPTVRQKDDAPGAKKDVDPPPVKKLNDPPPVKTGSPNKNDDPPAVKKVDRPAKKDPPPTDAPPPKKGTNKKDKDGGR